MPLWLLYTILADWFWEERAWEGATRSRTLAYLPLLLNCSLDQCTPLHWAALHYTTLSCTTLHCTELHYTTLQCTELHYTTLHCTELQYTALLCKKSQQCSRKHSSIPCDEREQCTVLTLDILECWHSLYHIVISKQYNTRTMQRDQCTAHRELSKFWWNIEKGKPWESLVEFGSMCSSATAFKFTLLSECTAQHFNDMSISRKPETYFCIYKTYTGLIRLTSIFRKIFLHTENPAKLNAIWHQTWLGHQPLYLDHSTQ